MRVICTLLAAVFAITIATAAQADCGCSKKHESCGCATHKKCGGNVQLLPDAPQDAADLPQCCERLEYSICCGHETFQLLCEPEPCKKQKCESDCGCDKCSAKKKCGSCNKCARKKCGCGKCGG